MGKTHGAISPELERWIGAQRIFFVATAPLSSDGHVNCSPKGGDTFRVLSSRQVAYQDMTGSGIETIAHLRENGRILIMFCGFDSQPQIARLHGKGHAVFPSDAEWESLAGRFPKHHGVRAIIVVEVQRISTSCGYAVPHFDYAGPREVLENWAEKKGPEGLVEYRAEKNRFSIDKLPAYPVSGGG